MKKIIAFLRKSKLFYRLFIAFLLLTILPTIFFNLLWLTHFKDEVLDLSSQLTRAITSNSGTILTEQLNIYEELSHQIYTDPEMINLIKMCNNIYLAKDFMNEKSHLYLEYKHLIGQKLYELTLNYPYISNIQIVTSYDQFSPFTPLGVQSGGIIHNLPNFLSSPYYLDALAAKGYPIWFDTTSVHNIFYRPNNATYGLADTLTLTRAILNPYTDIPLGVIVINVQKNFLTNVLIDYPLSQNGNLLLMSEQGIITSLVHRPKGPLIPKQTNLTEQIIGQSEGTFTKFLGNQYCFISYKQVSNTHFYLVNVIDYSILIYEALHVVFKIILLSFMWLIISALISYVITSSVTLPLHHLQKSMSAMTLDTLNIIEDIEGEDELGILGKHFNQMIENLKLLIYKAYISELKEKDTSFKHKNAELNALQMQINPHFLYNTLDMIRWEAMYEANGENKVTHMIEDFSKLLRLGTKKNMDFVPLEEELAHVRAYVKVINYKFTNPIELTLDTSLDTLAYSMPKLLLQPLVENAILHGFEGYEGDKKLLIHITQTVQTLCFEIANTGRPLPFDRLIHINLSLQQNTLDSSSIGIYNVNDRLKLYFDTCYTFKFTHKDGFSTCIDIKFPLQHIAPIKEE